LPLAAGKRIHVAGKCADNIGNQCGGWTITWQGAAETPRRELTFLEAIRKAAGSANVTYSLDGSGADGASVAVAVIGETPYAEMKGDRENLNLDPEDIGVVDRLKRSGIPIVVVLVSGRPMAIDGILSKADAIVAAWLPGTEGEAWLTCCSENTSRRANSLSPGRKDLPQVSIWAIRAMKLFSPLARGLFNAAPVTHRGKARFLPTRASSRQCCVEVLRFVRTGGSIPARF